MGNRREDLERILDLRGKGVLIAAEQQELMKLELRRKKDMALTNEELLAKLSELNSTAVTVSAENIEELIADYNEQYGNKDWYTEPKVEGDMVTFTFDSQEDCGKFFMNQSKKPEPFVLFDPVTKQVTAYSKGDGTLYHANGKEYKAGDEFTPSDIKQEDFKIPGLPVHSSMSSP